jgi:hypothetical protein
MRPRRRRRHRPDHLAGPALDRELVKRLQAALDAQRICRAAGRAVAAGIRDLRATGASYYAIASAIVPPSGDLAVTHRRRLAVAAALRARAYRWR